jgi:periplasmic protein TonB
MAISLLMLARRHEAARQMNFAESRYGYGTSGGQRWMSAGLALGIAGGVCTALALALVAPEVERYINPAPIDTHPVPVPPPPTPDDPLPDPVQVQESQITRPDPLVPTPPIFEGPTADPSEGLVPPPTPFPGGDGGTISGTGTDPIVIDPPRDPVFVPASRNPRFADAFQPPYPASAEREGLAGTVRVRVRISPDGRVISVEDLGSTDPRFFTATQRHALSRWRFRAATRDGVAVESTQELTVRFVLPTNR